MDSPLEIEVPPKQSDDRMVFIGNLVFQNSPNILEIDEGFLMVEDGKIVRKGDVLEYSELLKHNAFKGCTVKHLKPEQFLLPGFVDCHTHGPQYPNIGLGLDRPLLEWLEKYTFPLETQFAFPEYANQVYARVVRRLLKNGTTTACYFGSIHLGGTLELVKNVIKFGQRAFVGKVSMNVRNQANYYLETEGELRELNRFIEKVQSVRSELVAPIVTPRFALSCDKTLMARLATMAAGYNVRIQTHISENTQEVAEVLKQHPDCANYAQVYDKAGLLNDKCILAHAVHLSDEEISLVAQRGASVAHCPASNTRLGSGLCPVRKLIDAGIRVGLGTDVSGGDGCSMLDAMRRAMDVSKHLEMTTGVSPALTWKEALYLATMGGATALGLEDKIGSFDVGKEFDALLIDVYVTGGPIENYGTQSLSTQTHCELLQELVQRFVYLGDDRNVTQVYVGGRLIKDGWTLRL